MAAAATSAPVVVPDPPGPLAPPPEWLGDERVRAFLPACALRELEEQWESAGSVCKHAFSAKCASGSERHDKEAACQKVGLSDIKVRKFKIDYQWTCSGQGATLESNWPFEELTLTLDEQRPCNAAVPAWVGQEIERRRAIVGGAPPALAGLKLSSDLNTGDASHVHARWELAWDSGSFDRPSIEARLEALGYRRVASLVDFTQWVGDHESFGFAANGYLKNRLVVSRWSEPVARQ